MRALIMQTFPEHGIIGEEFAAERPEAEYVWVLDPIDGTKSFICGMPAWGTLIALTRGGEPIYGMMHQPFTREHFAGDCSAAVSAAASVTGRLQRGELPRPRGRPRPARAGLRGLGGCGAADHKSAADERCRPSLFCPG